MVAPRLVEWLLPIPEVCRSNPSHQRIFISNIYLPECQLTQIKEKRPGMAHFLTFQPVGIGNISTQTNTRKFRHSLHPYLSLSLFLSFATHSNQVCISFLQTKDIVCLDEREVITLSFTINKKCHSLPHSISIFTSFLSSGTDLKSNAGCWKANKRWSIVIVCEIREKSFDDQSAKPFQRSNRITFTKIQNRIYVYDSLDEAR